MRVLLDSNVLISAAINKGKPRKLLLKALAGEFVLVSSNELLKELEGVIARPKFRLSSSEVQKFVSAFKKTVELVKVKSNLRIVEDPADDKVLNAAYDGKVDYIVTGDADLLKLKEFRGIKIVPASRMLEMSKLKE